MKKMLKNRRQQYGGLWVALTVLVLICALLANVLVSTLGARYGWYADLQPETAFPLGERSVALIRAALDASPEQEGVQIHFCSSPEELRAGDLTAYLWQTANELAATDDRIQVVNHNILLDPESVREYLANTVIDPETGNATTQQTLIKSTNVIITAGEYHRVYALNDFFVMESDSSTATAYKGEAKLTAAILRAVAPSSPVACLTNNHGEVYYDYEILYLLDDAGYEIRTVDVSRGEIPADCSLLVCFNPNNDLAEANGIAGVSESEILNEFLAVPGHALLVFLENKTPELPNLDNYLATWGIAPDYARTETGSYRYMVRDEMNSTTSDGYTVPGTANPAAFAQEILEGQSRTPVFSDASGFSIANGFSPAKDGSFVKGDRRVVALYESGEGAVSWANGEAVDFRKTGLMAYSRQQLPGGESHVVVVFSVNYATGKFLQPGAYGNADCLLSLFQTFGGGQNTLGMGAVAFPSATMYGLTRGMRIGWTLALTILPALVVAGIALPILVRRKHS